MVFRNSPSLLQCYVGGGRGLPIPGFHFLKGGEGGWKGQLIFTFGDLGGAVLLTAFASKDKV